VFFSFHHIVSLFLCKRAGHLMLTYDSSPYATLLLLYVSSSTVAYILCFEKHDFIRVVLRALTALFLTLLFYFYLFSSAVAYILCQIRAADIDEIAGVTAADGAAGGVDADGILVDGRQRLIDGVVAQLRLLSDIYAHTHDGGGGGGGSGGDGLTNGRIRVSVAANDSDTGLPCLDFVKDMGVGGRGIDAEDVGKERN
jgi:hypothetical protein